MSESEKEIEAVKGITQRFILGNKCTFIFNSSVESVMKLQI